MATEYFTGEDASGSEGDTNRVLTLSNTSLTEQDGMFVHVSGLILSLTSEYTVSHSTTSTQITFLNALWNNSNIVVTYNTIPAVSDAGTANDFENGPLNDFGVDVTRTPVTVMTDNIGGQKTYSDGSTSTITVVFENPNQNFGLDKAGLTEHFDARLFCKATQTMNKYDKITYDSKDYRVDKVSIRYFNGTAMFKTVNLFFIQ